MKLKISVRYTVLKLLKKISKIKSAIYHIILMQILQTRLNEISSVENLNYLKLCLAKITQLVINTKLQS